MLLVTRDASSNAHTAVALGRDSIYRAHSVTVRMDSLRELVTAQSSATVDSLRVAHDLRRVLLWKEWLVRGTAMSELIGVLRVVVGNSLHCVGS